MTEETLFHEALSKPTSERSAFLDAACANNPELRAAVDALLAAHEASGGLLDQPPVDLGQTVDSAPGNDPEFTSAHLPDERHAVESRVSNEAGILIGGRYTLVEKLGEGGMGEVWVAKQSEPVKRKVALKLIKTGMDTRAVLARFEQERQALALMDHPNIARVLDGGMTPTGQPFFVMELVNGLALTKFCDEMKLTPKQRLELFVPICQAVQHAHQKGIVHRDLKPANILVTIIDGRPVPKVIDFGVAKAVSGKLTEETLSTQFGAVVGTLEYMSPEQAGFSGQDIDTRADIYSLGVILYELLTGLRPIDNKRLRKAAMTEMVRMICEEEPSKPSTRLSTDEALPSLAALRQMDPKKLMAMLRGELDWVIMKCLEKQRDQRYETANALSQDIQRYLTDEPVEARPPSIGYRFTKFIRRHRVGVFAATAVTVALLSGAIVGTWQAIRASRAENEEREAKQQAEALAGRNGMLATQEAEQRKKADAARVVAENESKRADKERLQAETAKYAMQLKLADMELERYDIVSARRTLTSTKPDLRGWEYDHLVKKCDRQMKAFDTDNSYTSVAITPDGTLVAGGSRNQLRVWNFAHVQLVKEIKEENFRVSAVAFNPDGKRIAVLTDETVNVWEVGSWTKLGQVALKTLTVRVFDSNPLRIVFSPNGDKIAVVNGGIHVWDSTLSKNLFTRRPKFKEKEKGGYRGVAFDPQGNRLAVQLVIESPKEEGGIKYEEEFFLVDATTGKQLATSGRENAVSPRGAPMAFDPKGQWFYSTGNHRLVFRDPTTAKIQRATTLGIAVSVSMNRDASRLAVIKAVSSNVNVYQLPDLELSHNLPFESVLNEAEAVAISADGKRVVAASRGSNDKGKVVGWVVEGDDATINIAEAGKGQRFPAIAASVEAGRLAVGMVEVPLGKIKIDPKTKRPIRPKQTYQIQFYSLQNGRLLFSLPKTEGILAHIQLSRDGKTLITADARNSFHVWDVASRKISREITVPGLSLTSSISMDDNAKFLCATIRERKGSANVHRILLWETSTGQEIWKSEWKDEGIPIFGPEGANGGVLNRAGTQFIVIRKSINVNRNDESAGRFQVVSEVKRYDLKTKKILDDLRFNGAVTASFSPTGKWIFLHGKGIILRDLATGRQSQISEESYQQIFVTRDNKRLIAVQNRPPNPTRINCIDMTTHQVVFQLSNEKMRCSHNGVLLTEDGKNLITMDGRKVVMLIASAASPAKAE